MMEKENKNRRRKILIYLNEKEYEIFEKCKHSLMITDNQSFLLYIRTIMQTEKAQFLNFVFENIYIVDKVIDDNRKSKKVKRNLIQYYIRDDERIFLLQIERLINKKIRIKANRILHASLIVKVGMYYVYIKKLNQKIEGKAEGF
ncbi:MAG: hypothetical protein QXV17_12115 [Candidatus Micrarchaeaceae archaeon]